MGDRVWRPLAPRDFCRRRIVIFGDRIHQPPSSEVPLPAPDPHAPRAEGKRRLFSKASDGPGEAWKFTIEEQSERPFMDGSRRDLATSEWH